MKAPFTWRTDEEHILKLKKCALDEKKTAAQIIEEALELYYQSKEEK